MNLCRCEKGHFYDKEKFASCPHCAGGAASDAGLTEAFTVPIGGGAPNPGQPYPSPEPPAGAGFSAPPMAPPIASMGNQPVAGIPADQVTVPLQNVPPLQSIPPMQNTPPVANIPADAPTVPLNMDTPTIPLDIPDPFQQGGGISDNAEDCTVGFFDDVFSSASSQEKAVSPAPAAGTLAKMPVVNKVATPCVGWLIALGGEHLGTDFRLKVGKNIIGRSPQMDIALTEDKSVSRDRHAIVVYEPKAHLYLVQPGESSSLVYRNNEVVLTPVKLEAYDMITVGDVNLLFMPLCGERFNWGDLLEEIKKKNK